MALIDKFIHLMKLNPDDYDDEDFLDDEVPEEEEEPAAGRRMIRSVDDDEDLYGDSILPEPYEEPSRTRRERSYSSSRTSRDSDKISPIRSSRSKSTAPKGDREMKVCVIRPHTFNDVEEISQALMEGCTVILNLEALEMVLAQRVVDYASGTCYALNGHMRLIASGIVVVVPSSTELEGDFPADMLNEAFDIRSM